MGLQAVYCVGEFIVCRRRAHWVGSGYQWDRAGVRSGLGEGRISSAPAAILPHVILQVRLRNVSCHEEMCSVGKSVQCHLQDTRGQQYKPISLNGDFLLHVHHRENVKYEAVPIYGDLK